MVTNKSDHFSGGRMLAFLCFPLPSAGKPAPPASPARGGAYYYAIISQLTQHFKTHHSCHIDRMGDISCFVFEILHLCSDVLLRACPKNDRPR